MKEQGFILITALIFLSLLSLMAFQTLESVLLQEKIQKTWRESQALFYLAEQRLKSGEDTLKNNQFNDGYVKVDGPEKNLMKDNVTLNYYRITASASNADMTVTLQSTYVNFNPPKTIFDGIQAGRKSWLQLDEDE